MDAFLFALFAFGMLCWAQARRREFHRRLLRDDAELRRRLAARCTAVLTE
ncbi:MAG TPA: hypothetical protein VFA75_05260 [Nevskia sp.]|nr:hypothetical protein [Nevskia sp.]